MSMVAPLAADGERFEGAITALQESAARVSRQLGYRSS
jgi:hypothetical protein